MTEDELKLFNDLVKLTKETEAFYITEQVLDDVTYWIFLYRLASYSDFMQPGALESRGIMFEVKDGNPVRLVCRPPHKFFNLGENPVTLDLDHSDVENVMIKEDGSLISTFWHKGSLRLKTKGSLFSPMAIDAMAWLERPENKELKGLLSYLTHEKNITVNLEWVSPTNRIVLAYDKPSLVILNMRYTSSGNYVKYTNQFMVKDDMGFYSGKTLEELRSVEGIEGWVCEHTNGTWFKLKTNWYVHLHHNKDSVNNPKQLFNAVLDETTDDLKQLFTDDEGALKQISIMEEIVEKHFNHNSALVDEFYEKNKHLDKKDYAILGQKELDKTFFKVAMDKYLGRNSTVKEVMSKHYQKYVEEFNKALGV